MNFIIYQYICHNFTIIILRLIKYSIRSKYILVPIYKFYFSLLSYIYYANGPWLSIIKLSLTNFPNSIANKKLGKKKNFCSIGKKAGNIISVHLNHNTISRARTSRYRREFQTVLTRMLIVPVNFASYTQYTTRCSHL